MDSLLASIHAHPAAWALVSYAIFSNAVSALPTPTSSTGVYRWVFDFAHLAASNIWRVVSTRFPSVTEGAGPRQP
jgi:hypothetical protein